MDTKKLEKLDMHTLEMKVCCLPEVLSEVIHVRLRDKFGLEKGNLIFELAQVKDLHNYLDDLNLSRNVITSSRLIEGFENYCIDNNEESYTLYLSIPSTKHSGHLTINNSDHVKLLEFLFSFISEEL